MLDTFVLGCPSPLATAPHVTPASREVDQLQNLEMQAVQSNDDNPGFALGAYREANPTRPTDVVFFTSTLLNHGLSQFPFHRLQQRPPSTTLCPTIIPRHGFSFRFQTYLECNPGFNAQRPWDIRFQAVFRW